MSSRAYIELTKPKLVFLLTYTGIISGILGLKTSESSHALLGLVVATLAVILATMGTNAVTNYIDRDIDSIMNRTKKRALPTGRIHPPEKALYFGCLLFGGSLILLISYGLFYSVIWAFLGFLFSAVFYNFLTKRRSPANIIIASPAGGAPVMGVWSAVTGQFIALEPLFLAILIVVWTPVHIWSLALKYSEDYRKVHVPMLPVVVSRTKAIRCITSTVVLLVVFSTALWILAELSLVYLIGISILNAILLVMGIQLIMRTDNKYAWRMFKFTNLYLAVAFLLVVL